MDKKCKIGILTFHRSINNGAVMQAYSLSKKLQEIISKEQIEIVDYTPLSVYKAYQASLSNYFYGKNPMEFVATIYRLIKNPYLIKHDKERIRAFASALTLLPLSIKSFITDDCEDVIEYINKQYKVVIVGSDAVWNYCSRGFPNLYYPDSRVKPVKMSYAASCYGMEYLSYSNCEKNLIKEVFDRFQYIGVRDQATEKYVEWSGTGIKPHHTCDPTVFLDVNTLPIKIGELQKKLKDRGFDFGKPAVAVMGSEKIAKIIRNICGDKFQIVGLYTYNSNVDINLFDLTPFEWAYAFRYFKLTVTTYFHGTLLSLKNNTPVICLGLNTQFSKKYIPKTLDLLTRLDLKQFYIGYPYDESKIREMFDNIIYKQHEYKILEKIEKEALSFEKFASELKLTINKIEEGKQI